MFLKLFEFFLIKLIRNIFLQKNFPHFKSAIARFINWYQAIGLDRESLINRLLGYLPRNSDTDRERIIIKGQIAEFENPQLKRDLVERMVDEIQDPVCTSLLSQASTKEENEETEPLHCQDYLKMTYSGKFPYWALQLLIQNDWRKNLVHFLPLVLSDATEHIDSPQRIGEFLRQISYQILFKNSTAIDTRIKVYMYDREGQTYQSHVEVVNRFQDELDIFNSNMDEEVRKWKRRNFLLCKLITDKDHAEKYKEQMDTLSNDMKLTLAVTVCWIRQANPDSKIIKSMKVLLALMQMKECDPGCSPQVEQCLSEIKQKASNLEENVDAQVLQWISQWVVLMDESISINQILLQPFPEPRLGHFFSGATVEAIYILMSEDESRLEIILDRLTLFERFLEQTVQVFSMQ